MDEWVVVEHVYDGDTFRLRDGRRVRLLGIDTPELRYDGRASDPFARKAQQRLQALVSAGRVGLRYDVERYDRYGRSLAHVFTSGGENVQALLLAAGLASTFFIPPNEWQHACYLALERTARRKRLAMWSHPRYGVIPAEDLATESEGYHIVTGRVRRVSERKSGLWVELTPDLAVHIPTASQEAFGAVDFTRVVGRQITARGRVYPRGRRIVLLLYHPAALELGED